MRNPKSSIFLSQNHFILQTSWRVYENYLTNVFLFAVIYVDIYLLASHSFSSTSSLWNFPVDVVLNVILVLRTKYINIIYFCLLFKCREGNIY